MGNESEQLFGGGWTEEKLRILKEYLEAYNKALRGQPFRRVYVDAFAGTGYRQQRRKDLDTPELFSEIIEGDTGEFLKGSARLALEVFPPFHDYVFIESDPGKVGELEKLRHEHPNKADHIRIVQGEANAFVQNFCSRMSRSARAVLFLDPFATEVAWETIEAVARTQAIDVWILFPLMAVNRLLARDPNKAWREQLDRIFGTDDWYNRFYRADRGGGIFEDIEVPTVKRSTIGAIGKFFQERLKSVFAGVAPSPRILKNSRGTPLFQFFFAAGNAKGASIAVRIAEHLLTRI